MLNDFTVATIKGMKPQIAKLRTNDACEIRLHKQAAHGPHHRAPVLLVHGFAANAHMWRPPSQEGSLASFLNHHGYPVYAIDLRHRRGAPQKDWNLDDYVLFDIPTALGYIQDDTGCQQVHWIGHSMGGMLGYMYQALAGSSRLLSLTTLGSPGLKAPLTHGPTMGLGNSLFRLVRFGLSTGRLDLIPRQVMAYLLKLGLLSDQHHRRDLGRHYEEDLKTKHILGNISFDEIRQITSITSRKGVHSPRFRFYYHDHRENIQAPLLALAGNRDYIVPAKLVERGFLDANTPHKTFKILNPRENGGPYGHLDLIMSPYAKDDIWLPILDWVERWDAQSRLPQHDSRLSHPLVGRSAAS